MPCHHPFRGGIGGADDHRLPRGAVSEKHRLCVVVCGRDDGLASRLLNAHSREVPPPPGESCSPTSRRIFLEYPVRGGHLVNRHGAACGQSAGLAAGHVERGQHDFPKSSPHPASGLRRLPPLLRTLYGGGTFREQVEPRSAEQPLSGRVGFGSSLLESVCTWAAWPGYPAVTLSTFRHIR